MIAFISTLCATSISPTTQAIHDDLSGGRILDVLPFSLYILGMGLGALNGAACSELFGHRPSFFVNIPLFALMQLGAGLSRKLLLLICFRFLAGLFAGTNASIGYSVTMSMWFETRRTLSIMIHTLALLLGQTFGYVRHHSMSLPQVELTL